MQQSSNDMLEEVLKAADLEIFQDRLSVVGNGELASCFAVTDLATASIAAASLAVAEFDARGRQLPSVTVDRRLASLWFGMTIRPTDWQMPTPWDEIAGDYETADGWIKLHTNAPHHKRAALAVLGCASNKEAVVTAVRRWAGEDLENAVVTAGGCAAYLRTAAEWSVHGQGIAVAGEALMAWETGERSSQGTLRRGNGRPLAGIRVLDLTRVLAGPVATRFLAGYGAEVLRLDPPDWEEPGVVPEVTPGKRCARLDLHDNECRRAFEYLLSTCDIVVHGYRSGALDSLGYDHNVRSAIRPGLIDISLNAYGHSGPWESRRGFDSLVQFSTGIAASGMQWAKTNRPISLPVQALDQATGYLLACAAVKGLLIRDSSGIGGRARLSLARIAALLSNYPSSADRGEMASESEADVDPKVEGTAWGQARRLRSPVSIGGTELFWDLPAQKLGSSAPEWR